MLKASPVLSDTSPSARARSSPTTRTAPSSLVGYTSPHHLSQASVLAQSPQLKYAPGTGSVTVAAPSSYSMHTSSSPCATSASTPNRANGGQVDEAPPRDPPPSPNPKPMNAAVDVVATTSGQSKQADAASRSDTSPRAPRHSPSASSVGAFLGSKKRRGSAASTDILPTAHAATIELEDAGVAKKSRPDIPKPHVLPARYDQCPVHDMVECIAHMVAELITANDAIGTSNGGLTRFHSKTAPGISVRDYLHRLAKHATLTPPLLLVMVYYIDRLCLLYQDFTINTLTVHRFLITAATVASKGLSDAFWNNTTYARVGGVRVAELNLLELEFLRRVDWKIVPDPEVLVAYYRGLVERMPGYILESDPLGAIDEDDVAGDAMIDEPHID